MKRKCEVCGKEYESNSRKYLYCCSNICLAEKKKKHETSGISICECCGKKYFKSKPGWNWNKNNELVKIKGSAQASSSVSSDRFCCYECGKKYQTDKALKTSIKKYGGIGFASTELKNKALQKTENLYGDKNYTNREQAKQTCLKKYGSENISKSEYGKKLLSSAIKKVHEERGNEIIAKIKATKLKRYGDENYVNKEKCKETCIEKYGTKYYFETKDSKEKIIKTCIKKYSVPYPCMTQQCREADPHAISNLNKKFAKELNDLGIETEFEFHLNDYSYDIKLKNKNVLIEINPTITHTSSDKKYIPLERFNPKDKFYHINKSKNALENNYFTINIWDWDDQNKILNLLKPKNKLYARNLTIKEVTKKEMIKFLTNYHIQGVCKGQEIRLGLYNENNELIEFMSFGKPRYNKSFEYELLRLCTKTEYKVIGGAEKLFSYFIKNYHPSSIISYCDNSKFKGEVYSRLNMILIDYGKPSKHWYNIKTHRHITDNLLKQRGYSQLHNDKIHKKGESNQQLMLEAGYLEIYDCGQSTYVWKSLNK